MNLAVFVSRPAALSQSQRSTLQSWYSTLASRGLELRTLSRDNYASDPWPLLRDRLGAVQGAVIFGFRQIDVVQGVLRPGTDEQRRAPEALASPWTQIEAGIAISAGLPVLALAQRGVSEGVFDPTTWGTRVFGQDLGDSPALHVVDRFLNAIQLHLQKRPEAAGQARLCTLRRATDTDGLKRRRSARGQHALETTRNSSRRCPTNQ
jgi:hypothetical protein